MLATSMGFLGLFFTAAALLLMWLTFLAGVKNSNPLNIIYFLQADTGSIPGAPPTSRWTFFNLCSVLDNKSICGKNVPDFPFDPASPRNFGTTQNMPIQFVNNHKHYFYMSRFLFPFEIIALFFGVLSFFTGFMAMCWHIGGYLSALLSAGALFFQIIVTAMMTAVFVQGRNAFQKNGQRAHLGVKAFAFMWTAVACLFIANVLYCLGGVLGRGRGRGGDKGYSGRDQRRRGFFSSDRSNSIRSNKETAV